VLGGIAVLLLLAYGLQLAIIARFSTVESRIVQDISRRHTVRVSVVRGIGDGYLWPYLPGLGLFIFFQPTCCELRVDYHAESKRVGLDITSDIDLAQLRLTSDEEQLVLSDNRGSVWWRHRP